MPMRVTSDFQNVQARLRVAARLVPQEVREALKAEAEGIQKVARDYAPLEHGNLMDSIKVANLGQRLAFAVYIDKDHPDDTGRYTVGAYGFRLHEDTNWKRGPKTISPRGPKFLERALRERSKGMLRRLADAAARGLKRLGY